MKHQTTRSTIFDLHGVPAFNQAFPLALQHVVAMIVGCVTPAIIVSGVAGLSEADSVILIQAALVTSALATLLQLFPFIKTRYLTIGSGLPVIMGISFAYVPSMQSIAEEYDVATILGAMIAGGIVAVHGGETTKQAIRIKQLYTDFNADYCVLDGRNAGISVYDMLAKVLFDEERNVEYKPWKCMNDDKVANRIQIAGAEENVYIIKAQLETNSNIAESMRNALNSGMIDLLISNTEAVDEIANFIPEYASADVDTQLFFERPYIETVALINEMINLEYERGDQTGLIKIMNNSDRKDRYTSVSYGNYFAQMLEHDLLSDTAEYDYVPLFN